MDTKLTKNQTANTGKYSYQYVDIAQIHDYLENINARYIQCIKRIENDDYIMTKRCFKDIWEDEWLQGCKVVDATLIGVNNPAQQQGSALTYARRYSLLMAFGLATEDDDAASLTKKLEVTKEDADKYVFTFGTKHKGHKLTDVIKDDPKYIDWLIAKSNDEYLLKCIELLTGQVKPSEEELKEQCDLLVEFQDLVNKTNTNKEDLYKHYGVKNNTQMTTEQFKDAISIMKMKLK